MSGKDGYVSATSLWAAVSAATVGVLFYNVMPVFLGSLQDSTELTGGQIGIVASLFFFGFNLVSASSFFWVRRIEAKSAMLTSSIALGVLLLASAMTSVFPAILAFTVAVGGASGALAAIAATMISDSSESTHWYGVKVAAESAAGVLLLFVLPATLIPAFGFLGTVFGMIALIAVLALPILFLKPGTLTNVQQAATNNPTIALETVTGAPRGVGLSLVAMLVLFVGGSAIWAFEERIANLYGFNAAWVGMILGISLFFAVVGPLAAGSLGKRFGNRAPYVFGVSLMISGVFAIAGSQGTSVLFALGACLFMLGWGGSLPFLYAKVADNDPNGRFIALTIPALGVGSMIGPAIAGYLYENGSIGTLQWMSVAMLASSAMLVWLSGARRERVSAPLA